MKVWTVMTQKGGVGKTTTVVSLAGALSARGLRVLIVDLDPGGSCSSYFGFDPDNENAGVHELFASVAEKCSCVVEDLVRATAFDELSIMPAASALVSLERRCGSLQGMGRVLADALPALERHFDYCLIDCPPTLGMLVINALAVARFLIVPIQTEEMALRSLDALLRTLTLLGNSTGRTLPSLVVPTLFDRRTRASRDSLLTLRCREDINLWDQYIPVDTQLREASRLRVPLTVWQPEARASRAYERLLDTLQVQSNNAALAVG